MFINKKSLFIVSLVTMIFLVNPLATSMQSIQEDRKITSLKDIISTSDKYSSANIEDFDPLVDIYVTVSISEIRAFDLIDSHTAPDFFVKVIINGESFTSPIWKNQDTLTDIDWSCQCDVPDEEEFVEIIIQLWDSNLGFNTLCDIASNDNENPDRYDLYLLYSIKSGHWYGDDMIYVPHSWSTDLSGYGRGNGCDDNSIYEEDYDCEIYFDITQNDFDNDGIPYWTETEIFNTDPTSDDRGRDDDKDGVPIEWEYRWSHELDYEYNDETDEWEIVSQWFYDPFEYNPHNILDPDADGLTNLEEYYTWQWGSDPYRKDIFVELDQMQEGPDGQHASMLPEGAKELMYKAFNRQNVLLHIDDGRWENSGSDIIPFDESTMADWGVANNELDQIYQQYYINNMPDDWRLGVFHYGVVIYQSSVVNGNAFGSNRYQISAHGMELKARQPFPLSGNRDVVYASAYMHELGHSLGLMWLGGHDSNAYYPWQPLWWKFRPYRSVMNYGYMYGALWNLIDYSDGSRGKNDFNDWENIDYGYFQVEFE